MCLQQVIKTGAREGLEMKLGSQVFYSGVLSPQELMSEELAASSLISFWSPLFPP